MTHCIAHDRRNVASCVANRKVPAPRVDLEIGTARYAFCSASPDWPFRIRGWIREQSLRVLWHRHHGRIGIDRRGRKSFLPNREGCLGIAQDHVQTVLPRIVNPYATVGFSRTEVDTDFIIAIGFSRKGVRVAIPHHGTEVHEHRPYCGTSQRAIISSDQYASHFKARQKLMLVGPGLKYEHSCVAGAGVAKYFEEEIWLLRQKYRLAVFSHLEIRRAHCHVNLVLARLILLRRSSHVGKRPDRLVGP